MPKKSKPSVKNIDTLLKRKWSCAYFFEANATGVNACANVPRPLGLLLNLETPKSTRQYSRHESKMKVVFQARFHW